MSDVVTQVQRSFSLATSSSSWGIRRHFQTLFQQLTSMISFLQSLPDARDHRWVSTSTFGFRLSSLLTFTAQRLHYCCTSIYIGLTCDSTTLPDNESISLQPLSHSIHTLASQAVNSPSHPSCMSGPTWYKTILISIIITLQMGWVGLQLCLQCSDLCFQCYLWACSLRSLSDGLNVSLTWYFAIAFHFPEFSLMMWLHISGICT